MSASAYLLPGITAVLLTIAAVAAATRLARFGLREPAVWLDRDATEKKPCRTQCATAWDWG